MRMERNIIIVNESGSIIMPENIASIWMSEAELVELFGVIAPTLRNYLNLPQEMLYIHPYKKLYKTVSTRYFIIFVKHIDKQATYCFRLQILLLFDIV